MLRIYPERGGALVVMTNHDPGVDQDASVVGQTADALARAQGWPSD